MQSHAGLPHTIHTLIMRVAIVATLFKKYFYWCLKKPLETAPLWFILTLLLPDLILLLLLLLLWQGQVTLIAAFAAVCQCDNSTLASPAHCWLRQKAPTPLLSFLKSCHFIKLWQATFCTAITTPFPQCKPTGNSYQACPHHCSTLSRVIGEVTAHLAHVSFFLFTKSPGNSSPHLKGSKQSYQDGWAARDPLAQLHYVDRPLFQDKAG